MTRMIERWFPCAEVSAQSESGWGSGNSERSLFTWFAARPTAQAKAAVVCSLLPWPADEAEQQRLQKLVRSSMTGRYANWAEVRREILRANPRGASVLDPFSGRGMIPLEAARLNLPGFALDYSPVAVLASELLTDFPFRDWSGETPLPFVRHSGSIKIDSERLVSDLELFLGEVKRRYYKAASDLYPEVNGNSPWGYLWAVTLPCQECSRRFPLVGAYELRRPAIRKGKKGQQDLSDVGQSFFIDADVKTGEFRAVVHDGAPRRTPTFSKSLGRQGATAKGKSAVCPFCEHVHPISVHQRLAGDGQGRDVLLAVVDHDPGVGRRFREPTAAEFAAVHHAEALLSDEPPFAPMLPAVPDEQIPLNNGATIRPQLYGATTYGDLMVARQTLTFVRLSRAISETCTSMLDSGVSNAYARALACYAAGVMVRMLKFSTRGAKMRTTLGAGLVDHIFSNEGTIAFAYDFFEVGLADGPGSWPMMAAGTIKTLRSLLPESAGHSVEVVKGTAASQPYRDDSMAAVVTDPPYDSMVYYTDSSDFFFSWLKRALYRTHPEFAITADPRGLQDKDDEILVKEHGKAPGEHRDRHHYDSRIAKAFGEMRRVVREDGVVTIVFGHGEPEVWQRLLGAIQNADLVMTASWPANTEAGGQQGKANIETTLTMSCRPAKPGRPEGRKASVETEIKDEIKGRHADWVRWGLAPTDMLMAASGPAMEVVGRYSSVLDARGEAVDIASFLPLARAAVQEAMAVDIDHHPLETFDARTRFALWWVRVYGRDVVAKSELRWQALAASLEIAEVRDLVPDTEKGCEFAAATDQPRVVTPDSSAIDVALAMAAALGDGLDAVAEVMVASGRDVDVEDPYLWAAITFLADRLPDSDSDAIAWTRILRNRASVNSATKAVVVARVTAAVEREAQEAQMKLL
jgi:putative DNA methylase